MVTAPPDPVTILAALGYTGATIIEPVTGGWDTHLWRVEHGGSVYALRVFRPEQAAGCRREAIVMQAALAAGLAVPRVHAEGVGAGRPALLLGWCPGRPLVKELGAHPRQFWPLAVAFGRMQARIHTLPAPAVLRERPDAWLEWAGPEEEALRARLRALPARPDALLHLDYHPLNVMADDAQVTGVLDWANAKAGDPRADVARTFTIIRLQPVPGISLLETVGRHILALGWRRGYEQVAGPLGDLTLFYAWAGAVMLRDLAPRIGRADLNLQPRHFDRLRHWIAACKRQAGI